jgi:hypothetical protein
MVRGNPKRFEGFKFNRGTSVVGAGSPKPGEHHFFFPPPSFFLKKFTKKIRAGNDQAYEPLTASSPKSGTGEKKTHTHTHTHTLWEPTVLCPVPYFMSVGSP